MGNLEAWFGEPDMIVRLDCPATSDIPVVTGELEEGMDIEREDAEMEKSDSPGRSTPTEGNAMQVSPWRAGTSLKLLLRR